MTQPSTSRARLARALFTASLLLAAGTAEAQANRAEKLLSEQPAPRRGCRIAGTPGPLPSPAQLADSARLAAGLAAYAARFPGDSGKLFAVYSVSFGPDGAVRRVAPVDYWLPQGQEETLQRLVEGAILPQRRGPFHMRLRVEPAAQPVLRTGNSEVCAPESNARYSLTAPAFAGVPGSLAPVRLKMSITEDGRVANMVVVGSSGHPEVDRWVEASVLRYQFSPGLVDGAPTRMEHEQTIRVRTSR